MTPEKAKARKAVSSAVKAAQQEFMRQTSSAHDARRKVFQEAQEAGLTLREIGELADLHHTTVGEIIRGR
jgi:DNA-directed RNA polymerase specialized sigma24 family protein